MGSVLKPTQALKTYIVGFTSIAFTFIIFGTKFLKLPAQFLIGSPGTLGGRFKFFANTNGAVGRCQTGGAGSFPRTKREVFGSTKKKLFEFGVKYLNQIFEFWRHIFEFRRYIFVFWRHIFEIRRRIFQSFGPSSFCALIFPPTPCKNRDWPKNWIKTSPFNVCHAPLARS